MTRFKIKKNFQKAGVKAKSITVEMMHQASRKLNIRQASLTTFAILGASFGFATFSSPASAALFVRDSFNDAALSIDAFGSTSNNGTLQTNVPVGASILKAYLYASSIWNYSPINDVKLNGNLLKVSDAVVVASDTNSTTTVLWDVTSLLSSLGGLQNHTIEELGDNDGETLVVAYKNASTTGFSSFIFDGALATTGDTTKFNFAQPYNNGDFLVSLASTYSYQPSGQFTTVDVTTNSTNSRRLTSSAGGQDDGEPANGALITAGGIGDSPTNPDPFASSEGGFRTDDELYNLALGNITDASPFIKSGDTFVELKTTNPSNNDNVYGLFVTSTFKTSRPSTSVPEPSALLGLLAFIAFGGFRLNRKQNKQVVTQD
ncbi:PEP-CTERM sorting domain-containing protein [Nostocaceae cyanobacterium CENA369]|uniref:PEP-CTERM sorting domain-containing protein n=1 Tax=Dendronalium phyllosphericum CENA369 TaxID=1725256 RepID=A0A8J7LFM2_9NOST|nr:PEP-CTERM sorting domain-containing protein [Dendronalium phyllosphericum]MBH8573949.1 PEP-CTERM sorting domain-containing protein [Dendronalium phyllosphericum CENA369]